MGDEVKAKYGCIDGTGIDILSAAFCNHDSKTYLRQARG